MRVIRNRWIPFSGFTAMNLFGVLFIREDKMRYMSLRLLNHERIHSAQMKEMLYIIFYVWYIVEYLIKLCIYKDTKMAYRNISFEREAYDNENNLDYLCVRKGFSWFKLI